MRGIEAGDLRGYLGIAGRGPGAPERGALARTDAGGGERGPARGRVFEAFAGAVLGTLRGEQPGALEAGRGVRPAVESVAVALRDALASGESVDSLLGKVNDALAGAARELGLSEEGAERLARDFRAALADSVDALARRLADEASGGSTPSLPAAPTAPAAPATNAAVGTTPTAPTASTAPTAAVAGASYRVVQKTGIELLTQEGDVVRISLRTNEGFRAAGGYSPTGAYLDVAAYSKSRFTVEVQGSLSAAELAAIDDVLGQVDAIAKDFYAGDTAAAFAAGAALDVDAEQLAAVSLRMSQSTSLRVASRAEWAGGALPSLPTPRPAPLPQPVPLPTPEPQPPATANESTTRAPLDQAAAPVATDAVATSAAPTPATTAPATAAAAEGAARTTALRTMTDYLARLVDQLGSSTVAGRVEFSARAKLQLVVTAVDAARLPGVTPEADAAQMLAKVVGAATDRRVG